MLTRYLAPVLLELIICQKVWSQGKARFKVISHNFGVIPEKAGLATYKFEFVNDGDMPLVITSAIASCGCTAPTWSKEPLKPGESGYITVQYNPIGRPGAFVKTVTVHTNGEPSMVLLTIRGEVTEGDKPVLPKNIEYVQYFPYNEKVITMDKPDFTKFIDELSSTIKKNGKATIQVESSSSHVPTKKYKNNTRLTELRSADAKNRILSALKQRSVDVSVVHFNPDKNLVQGPEYKKDAVESVKEYESYQYVKIIAN
jgi:hypothetical protein